MGDAESIRQRIIEELIEASESSLAPSEVTDETHLRDGLGLDSLQAVTVIMGLEEVFEVEVDDDEIDRLQTVGDVLRLLAEKTGAAA